MLDQKVDAQITNKNISINRDIISTNYQRNFDLLLTKKIFNEQKLDINIPSSNINNMTKKQLQHYDNYFLNQYLHLLFLNPDKKSWDQISKIAFRTFVPESEDI